VSFRDSPFSDIKVPLAWTAAVAVIGCGIIALVLLIADRRETLQEQAYGQVKAVADRVQAPISEGISAPVRWTEAGVDSVSDYFFAARQNRDLKREMREMMQWRDAALALRDENDRFRALLGLKIDPPIPMVSGNSVMDSRGPFANSRLVNIGKEAGVKVGNPVMSEHGLVGRVVGVTQGASRVLLLTDVTSRTPVMIDRTNARAILSGDGGSNPKLAYLRSRDPTKVGDRIVTSGDGGVMPRGLPVGVAVKGVDGGWRVQLFSDRTAIDFVRILKFEDFSQLADLAELSATVTPAEMGGTVPPPVLAPPPVAVAPPAPVTPGTTPAAKGAATVATPAPKAATPATTPAPKAAAPAPPPAAPAPKAAAPTATPAPQ